MQVIWSRRGSSKSQKAPGQEPGIARMGDVRITPLFRQNANFGG